MDQLEVVLGVDTHLDVHVGVVIDVVGRMKGFLSIETNTAGYIPPAEAEANYYRQLVEQSAAVA